jgi:hypothetical protein
MDPTAIVVTILVALIGVGGGSLWHVHKRIDSAKEQCSKISDHVIIIETKLDIYLEHSGFDVQKVNKAIKENMEELKRNDKPTVGCIHIKELYKGGR